MSSVFDSHFSRIYGPRWLHLKESLLADEIKVWKSCFEGYARYYLDSASILAAEALQGSGSLVANEFSRDRRFRLMKVIEDHVPENIRPLILVTGFDGNQFGLKKPSSFDRVLLDAPCSSERHLLKEDPHMKEWKESRTKQLAMRQYSLICSALLTLKPGGTLVYSTCSISPLENDGVVGRLLKKKGDEVVLDSPDEIEVGEKTEFGRQIFPDQSEGAGPIYIARLKKIQK